MKPYLSRSGLGNDTSAAGAFHTFHAWPKGPPTCSSIKGMRQSGYSEDIMSLDLRLRTFPFPSSFMFPIYIAYTNFLFSPFFWMESGSRKTSPASMSFPIYCLLDTLTLNQILGFAKFSHFLGMFVNVP